MCGILGLFGDDLNILQDKKRSFMIEGLIVDQLRGDDGTGIAAVARNKKDDVKVFKKAIKGSDFVELKGTNRALNRMNELICVIGHNRSWTRGLAIDENCHPFQFKHISLVHNGTVTNAMHLVSGKDYKQLDVDSAHVAHAISLEDAESVLPKLEGGYSLVWWDNNERSLNFARNDARPMYFAYAHGKEQTMYYGSEVEMILLLAKRNDLRLHTEFLQTSPYIHYIFKDPKDVRSFTKRPFVKKPVWGQMTNYGTPVNNNWNPNKKGGNTSTTTKNDTPPSGAQSLIGTLGPTPIDKNMIRESDKVTPQAAATMSEKLAEGSKRHAELEELCDKNDVATTHASVWRAYKWVPYNIGAGEVASEVGTLTLDTYRAGKTLTCQVFNVQLSRWKSLVSNPKSSSMHLCLDIVNFRQNNNWQPSLIFVGKINEGLTEKYSGAGQAGKDSQAGSEGDPGTKSDWIEIGTSHKRTVSPEVLTNILESGCYCCVHPIAIADLPRVTWVGPNDDRPICESCSSDERTLETLAYMQ